MEKKLKRIDIKVVLAFAAVYLIWGSTYLAIKIGISHLGPFIMAGFRYLISGILLLIYCLAKSKDTFRKEIFRHILLGSFMLTSGQGVLFWAERYLSSGFTAVLTALLPVIYILIDTENRNNYFKSKLTIISVIMAMFGVIVLFNGQLVQHDRTPVYLKIIASAAVIGSCVCWAAGSLYYKNHSSGPLIRNVCWQLIGGSITCFLIGTSTGEWDQFNFLTVPMETWESILYLAIAGSIIAFSASLYLLSVRPPAVVGTYAYVNPIIAVILGYLVAKEAISISQIIGMGIIMAAAYLANKVKFKKPA